MKKKNIVILIVALLLILLMVILVLLKNLIDMYDYTKEYQPNIEVEINKTLSNVSNRSNYYIVQTCVNKFYIYNSLINQADAGKYCQEIYNMLDLEYIKNKEITQDNILNKLSAINSSKVSINEMYVCEQTENISTYFVYGTLRDRQTSILSEFSMMVKLDTYNKTFSIFLQDYMEEKYSDIKVKEEINITCQEQIEKNQDNMYTYEAISDETYITDVFDNFRENMIYNKKIAYESLDKQYREKRFPTFNEFEKYIKNNSRRILAMKIEKYQKNKNDNAIQYICVDQNNNYYIIDEISTMNCTFILDTYTIDLPQFITEYESADDNTKVALNLEKIREAINVKDFRYVFNKTDETFRNTKFKNYNDFEKYFTSNLFNENSFKYKEIQKQASVYIVTVEVTNSKNTSEEPKEIEIIMKLTDSTDYLISFNLEK